MVVWVYLIRLKNCVLPETRVEPKRPETHPNNTFLSRWRLRSDQIKTISLPIQVEFMRNIFILATHLNTVPIILYVNFHLDNRRTSCSVQIHLGNILSMDKFSVHVFTNLYRYLDKSHREIWTIVLDKITFIWKVLTGPFPIFRNCGRAFWTAEWPLRRIQFFFFFFWTQSRRFVDLRDTVYVQINEC